MPDPREGEGPGASIETDPYFFAIRAFCSRWKPFIIQGIRFDGKTRFSTFTKQLPISEKVLAANLRELEVDGVIRRKVFPEIPPRVEYQLTELGQSICPLLDALYKWGWDEMKRRGLPIDPLGEMWHGYRERDESFMKKPYK